MLVFLALFLLLHGFAHLVGFAGSWQLAGSIPYKTTVLGGAVDVGDAGIRAAGVLWLAAAVAFTAAAVAVLAGTPWWPQLTLVVAMFSLLMCVIGLPEARIGALLDAALIALLVAGLRLGWFGPVAGT